jgi:hypothetical protein
MIKHVFSVVLSVVFSVYSFFRQALIAQSEASTSSALFLFRCVVTNVLSCSDVLLPTVTL